MIQYSVIVNNGVTFDLFSWDANEFRNGEYLHLATDDLASVRAAFTDLKSIEIVDSSGDTMASSTEYDGFSSITYQGLNYSSQLGTFANELIIKLTKVSLVEQVQRIDQQLNPVIDINTMTLEEYKDYKINMFSDRGEQVIFAGTDVELGDGTVKNYTYDLEDQCNLLNALFIIDKLDSTEIVLPYHSHGEPCELFAALDIIRIYLALQTYSTTIQTLVNMKINWVRACQTKEEVEAITFESELPEEWQERAMAVLEPALELVEAIKEKYFGPQSSGYQPSNDYESDGEGESESVES
jgi:hypothetical protein